MVRGPRQRARVHAALIDLCSERGFSEVTVAALCERAGIEPTAFERDYTDLEDCFCEAYQLQRDLILERIATAGADTRSWRERLRATAYSLYRSLSADPKLTRFVTVEVRVAGERAQRIQWEGVKAMFDLLDEGREQRGAPETISRATAESIAGGVFNLLYAGVARGELPPEGEIVPKMMYGAVLPYLGPEAAAEELRTPPPPPLRD